MGVREGKPEAESTVVVRRVSVRNLRLLLAQCHATLNDWASARGLSEEELRILVMISRRLAQARAMVEEFAPDRCTPKQYGAEADFIDG